MNVLEPREAPGDLKGVQALEREMKLLAEAGPAEPRRYVPDRDGYWDGYAFEIDPDYPDVFTAVAAHRAAAGR
jgi:1-acyl-sn-glycerol-3-phosphate acyltransferase